MISETTETQLQNSTYWICFQESNGKIRSITKKRPSTDSVGSCVINSNDPVLRNLINGKYNLREYKVHWDIILNEYAVGKKKNYIELQPIANNLTEIPTSGTKRLDDMHIQVYNDTNTVVVSINYNRIKESFNLATMNGILESSHNLMSVYICKKNNPDLLLGTLEIDAHELFKNKRLTMPLPASLLFTNSSDISFFAIPLFNTYGISFEREFISTPASEGKYQYINRSYVHKKSQINIYAVNDNTIIIKSSIKDIDLFNGVSEFTMIVCNKDYDNLIGSVSVPIDSLVSSAELQITLPFNITKDPLFLYKNNNVSVSYNGEYHE